MLNNDQIYALCLFLGTLGSLALVETFHYEAPTTMGPIPVSYGAP